MDFYFLVGKKYTYMLKLVCFTENMKNMQKTCPMSRNYMDLRNTKVKYRQIRLPDNVQIHVISAPKFGRGGDFGL